MTFNDFYERELKVIDKILKKADIFIFGFILHDIAFWKGFGWPLQYSKFTNNKNINITSKLSFDWKTHRNNSIYNLFFKNILTKHHNIKEIYYWNSVKPSHKTGDCQYLYDNYDMFNKYTIDIFKQLNINAKMIDTHNVTFGYDLPQYRDTGGCHYSAGNTSNIVAQMYLQVILNALCNHKV